MKTFYVIWALICAVWGYLAADMWPKPTPYGISEVLLLIFGAVFFSALVAFGPRRQSPRPKPSLELRPWTETGTVVFVAFTFLAVGSWALIFALFSARPLWGGAFQFFLLGLAMFVGVYVAPVIFRSRFEV